VEATALRGAKQMTAGDAHTCALEAGGAVRCVGALQSGQLGSGLDVREPTPRVAWGACPDR